MALIVGLMLSFVAIAIVALLYAPLMMARTNGKTLGRMAMGIRVVRANGAADDVRLGDAARGRHQGAAGRLRELAHVRAREPADVLWPLWDDENRALHDFVVDTRTCRDCS